MFLALLFKDFLNYRTMKTFQILLNYSSLNFGKYIFRVVSEQSKCYRKAEINLAFQSNYVPSFRNWYAWTINSRPVDSGHGYKANVELTVEFRPHNNMPALMKEQKWDYYRTKRQEHMFETSK